MRWTKKAFLHKVRSPVKKGHLAIPKEEEKGSHWESGWNAKEKQAN